MSANVGIAPDRTNKRPSADEQAPGTYLQVEAERGIYRYKDCEGKITYHERPWIAGKRTWRSLGFAFTAQSSLKLAREEYHRRRAEVSMGRNPYAEVPKPALDQNSTPAQSEAGSEDNSETKQANDLGGKLTVSGILTRYRDAGFPDKYLNIRTGRTLELEKRNCSIMLEFFNGEAWDELLPPVWDKYKEWRVQRIKVRWHIAFGGSGNKSAAKSPAMECAPFSS